ncbi:Protein kinase 2B, chloroplastic [Apostasia shenzhenica]|uniref:Protein kinase 2B, chloroplastic n=1 Tax=Apostasia shenzhenica TaxID=1088818 RepID=A0A2I0AVB7_9ASPA|nr:Protein kinase 2B, chloroplastic [Apostasia shenzhenica]
MSTARCAFNKNKVGIKQTLVDWAKLFCVMDTRLEGQYPKKGAHTIVNLALQCISHEPKLQPTFPFS